MSAPKIYLAGPDVFEPNAIARGQQLKEICATHGAIGLFPLDNEISSAEAGSLAQAQAIRTANMGLIQQSDAILANMTPFRGPSMDVGTAYEMGAGAALGKIVVGYSRNLEDYVGKVSKVHNVKRAGDGYLRDEGDMAVEEFKSEQDGVGLVDNLMISCGVERLCADEEEGIKFLVELWKAREVKK